MSLSDTQFISWLDSSAIEGRCVLVEANVNSAGSETVRYLSSAGYVTSASDTPANTVYVPRISGGMEITEQLSLSGEASMAFTDVQLFNDGSIDSWLADVWRNRGIKIFLGDKRWPRADFRLIFDGVIDDIDSAGRNSLNLKARDKLQLINTPLTEAKIGGTGPNAEALVPLTFGECFNISPVLVDDSLHLYKVHDGPIESSIEDRDNGVPITPTVILSTGSINLTEKPVGQIAGSYQGDKFGGVYRNTIAGIIQQLVTRYGKASTRLTTADIDLANFAAFDAAHPQPVGFHISDRTNVIAACQELAASVGAQIIFNALGKLQIVQISLPAVGTPVLVTDVDMVDQSLHISDRIPVVGSVKVGYCKNYTPQYYPESGVIEEHKVYLKNTWRTVTQTDVATLNTYKLDTDPIQRDTLLLAKTDANAEALRELTMYKTQRYIYEFDTSARNFLLQLGTAITLQTSRLGLNAGKTGLLLTRRVNLLTLRSTIGVLA